MNKRNGFCTKSKRLNNPQDFKRCFQSGHRIKNKAFVLHYVNNGGLPARLGVNIAKSKIKKAVERNKIKRTVREAFRKRKLDGLDIVLILKNERNYYRDDCFDMINDIFDNLIKKNESSNN